MKPNKLHREAQRARDRFGNVSVPSLLRQLGRAARLHLSGRGVRRGEAPDRSERIVVSLSTTPARAAHLAPALRSLLDQDESADRIVLALPFRSNRNGAAYPPPEALPLPEGIEILRCEDRGPATKFLSTLQAEPEALVVVVDDDVVYPRSFLRELLLAHRRRPAAALALRGVRLRSGTRFADLRHVFGTGVRTDTAVSILFGTWGYLLPPGVAAIVAREACDGAQPHRWVDDIWLSAQLARSGIERFVVPVRGLPLESLAAWRGSLSGGVNRSGHNEEAALRALAGHWAGDSEETTA